MKIGSLFDGSGGFPLAATMCGIEPVWASEVEPFPIAVTRSRFPNMKHLGSVTDVKGNEVEPVDVITFGSPCQDLSVAGKRAGLKHTENGDEETTRSGLFMEAIRIIKEMREATNGKYPEFAVWENVPGAFSSNKGEDFRIVLEEIVKIVEPTAVMPDVPKNGWPYADVYCGDGWSLAYRILDAQYWGVPQRRRRIYLVADFRGRRAGKISFECDGLRGHFTESEPRRKAVTGDAESGIGTADCTGDSLIAVATQQGGAEISTNGICPTVTAAAGMSGNNQPWVTYALARVASTLRAGAGAPKHEQDFIGRLVLQPVPDILLDDQGGSQISVRTDGRVPTLRAEMHGNVPCVMEEVEPIHTDHQAPHLSEKRGDKTDDKEQPIVFDKEVYQSGENATGGHYISEEGLAPTLRATGHPPGVAVRYIVRRLTPTECARLQGFPDKWGHIDQKADFTDEEYAFWLEVRNTHAAINGKTTKDYTKTQMLTWYNKLHTDSSEYKMWGNGMAFPCVLYIMQGIAEAVG